MSIPAGSSAPGASSTGPALGYTLILFWFNILSIIISENKINTSTYFIHTLSLIYAIKLLVIFEIKIYQKLTSYLTDARPSGASGGGGKGSKRWRVHRGTRVAPSWASRGTVGEQMQRWALTDGAKGTMVFSHLS